MEKVRIPALPEAILKIASKKNVGPIAITVNSSGNSLEIYFYGKTTFNIFCWFFSYFIIFIHRKLSFFHLVESNDVSFVSSHIFYPLNVVGMTPTILSDVFTSKPI